MLHLTYHELELQNARDVYRVSRAQFEQHLTVLRGLDSAYCKHHVTFDDGHISNYDLALPLLEKYRIQSIFFITTEWIGAQDRMSVQHLRELLVQGHQVESHSCSHAFLPGCSDSRLLNELQGSRRRLEDVLGSAVTAASLPYGRWDRRVLRACLKAGYTQVYTSDPWLSATAREGIEVAGRLTLRNSVDAVQLRRLLTAKGLTRARLQMPFRMKQALKVCIGDRMYHRVWHAFANRNEYVVSTSYEKQ
ncbi:MAG TPA: polysaccharide deacetylase family protein [Candidatus Acidoferrum sp.]|nr:polysaccharide deacetylase family protein [Candidatus Acidoferrum sp.]